MFQIWFQWEKWRSWLHRWIAIFCFTSQILRNRVFKISTPTIQYKFKSEVNFLTVIWVNTICAHFHWQFKMIKLLSSALPTPVPWMGQNEINFGQMKINRLTSSTTNLKSKYWIEPSTKKQEKYRFLDMFVERKSGPSHKTIIKFVPMRFISVIRGHQERVDLTIEDVKTDILWLVSEYIRVQEQPFPS